MIDIEKALAAAKFVCDNLGQEAYVVDFLDCDECPDVEGESCPLRRPGNRSSVEKVNACREKRVTVRRIDMDFVDIRFNANDGTMEVVIDDCYYCSQDEIFTTKDAATAHMESLPPDMLKFYERRN